MKIRYDVISNVGRVRTNNEDMALVLGQFIRDDSQSSMVPMKTRPRFSALVADGMGGYGGGEVASQTVLESFDAFLRALPADMSQRDVIQAVKDWIRTVQTQINAMQAANPDLSQMGTTLTGIFTYGPWEFMVNCGDSRTYRLRYETLRQLSTDHSERERLKDPSVPSNLIYNAIGVPGVFIDVTCLTTDMPVIDGDIYLICSDGLSDMLSDNVIESILNGGGTTADLVEAALEAGGKDNCTAILLRISAPEEETETAEAAEAAEVAEVAEVANLATPEAPAVPEPVLDLRPLPPVEGFDIDAEPASEPVPESDPVPPPFTGVVNDLSGEQFITEEEARNLPPAEPTRDERLRSAAGHLRSALRDLFGRKDKS